MRDGWRLEKLGEISEVIMGRQLSPSKKMGTRPRPYIRAANIGSWGISLNEVFEMDFTEDEEARFASRIGDTLLVEGGNEKSVGCPGLVTENEAGLCIQNTVIRCRVKNPEVFHPEFQFQVLRYMYWRRDFAQLCAGTTIMHLGQKRAESVPILLPPLPEQKRIVDLISSVDSYIEALQLQLESAKGSRNAVLHELLTAGGENWVETNLAEVAVLNPSEPALSNTDHFAPMDAVHVGKRWLQYTEERRDRNGARARAGDVLFARITPCLENGKVAQVQSELQRCGGSTEFIVVRGTEKCTSDFLYFWCTLKENRDKAAELMTGTTGRQRLSSQDLGSLQLWLPSIKEQEQIVSIISEFDSLIDSTENAISQAQNLRSALLSDLLSGEHEIPASYDKAMGAA